VKLIELEIQNVRGIKDLKLAPGGKNIVVWGANGSGKSAVVDAIDFLLTGRITRLTGPGTGNITLGMHGAHIDCQDPSSAYVRAVVKVSQLKILRDVVNIFLPGARFSGSLHPRAANAQKTYRI
jgi:predicted ATP-binding protein involved in virulence